jgi:hypothetical protein
VLEDLEKWTRRRLRSAIWKQWKRGSVRFAELRKRGIGKDLEHKAGRAHSFGLRLKSILREARHLWPDQRLLDGIGL